MVQCDRALTPPAHLLHGHLRARLADGRCRRAGLRAALGVGADPGPGEDPGRPALPPGRSRRGADDGGRHPAARTPSGCWPRSTRPRQAVQSVKSFETGTIRFGMFGIARLYAGAGLIADVLARYPGVRVELVGQNSTEVADDLRRGRLEAAMLAVPTVSSEGMTVTPVAREELVYISADPAHLEMPVTAHRLSLATLVMSETTYRDVDSTRNTLRQLLHETGRNPQTRIEVEDIETAVELVGLGLADSVIPKGAAEQLLPRLAPDRGLGAAAAAPVGHVRGRAPHRRRAVPGGPADDRAGHPPDPGHRRADPPPPAAVVPDDSCCAFRRFHDEIVRDYRGSGRYVRRPAPARPGRRARGARWRRPGRGCRPGSSPGARPTPPSPAGSARPRSTRPRPRRGA